MTTPDDRSTHDTGTAGDDDVQRLQRDLDVANDCGPAEEDRPPGDPAG